MNAGELRVIPDNCLLSSLNHRRIHQWIFFRNRASINCRIFLMNRLEPSPFLSLGVSLNSHWETLIHWAYREITRFVFSIWKVLALWLFILIPVAIIASKRWPTFMRLFHFELTRAFKIHKTLKVIYLNYLRLQITFL